MRRLLFAAFALFVAVFTAHWRKTVAAWSKARLVDAHIESTKTDYLLRYGRARWPF